MEEFIKAFEEQFEDVKPGTLRPDTQLENIEEWGSLQAMVIIAMLDSRYNVKVNGIELQNAKTVADIYQLVQSRKNN